MKTVSEYCEKHVLVIPQALHAMQDVTLLLKGNSSVFYKCLSEDLLNVAFYSTSPCLVYIESGQEVLTTPDNDTLELNTHSLVLLPKGMQLHSDFVKSTQSLKAFLVFFDSSLISEFLSSVEYKSVANTSDLCVFEVDTAIQHYFASLLLLGQDKAPSFAHIHIKLLEMLHLLSRNDESFTAQFEQVCRKKSGNKPNLKRLLSSQEILSLSINDMANLSGRSVSTFSRDFKALFDTTPKQWLLEKRLLKAKSLLVETDLSVTHIASELGYDNVSHFIKAFKNKYELTPKQYKKSG